MGTAPRIMIVGYGADTGPLVSALSGEGYRVIISQNNEEAFDNLSKEQVDLVMIDITVPGNSGFDLTGKIKSAKNSRFTPVIMIMARGDETNRRKGVGAGCDDFIHKPFDTDEISTRVDTVIEISRCRPLLNEQERSRYILDNIGVGIIELDHDLKITHMNRKARELVDTGQDRAAENFRGYLESRFLVRYEGDLEAAVRSGAVAFDIERPETSDSQKLIFEVRTTVLRNPLGEISNILVILRDVTEARREEYMKQNFLGLISHKLRTPLAVIAQSAATIDEGIYGPLNDKQKKAVAGIVERSAALGGLIDKLLGFTGVTGESSGAADKPMDVKDYFSKLKERVIKREKTKKINVDIDCPDEGITVRMNRLYFDLVVSNLVENAVKFGDKEPLNVAISAKKIPGGVRISVSDNGRGIEPEEKEKVFEKFYQIDHHFTGNIDGAGLGLALVKHIADAYNGTVELDSMVGSGTTVSFTIPGE